MNIQIFGTKKSSDTRKAERFFKERGIRYQFVDLKEKGVILGKRKKNDVVEECRFAYKDIEEVMSEQQDMVTVLRKLKTVGVVKG